MNSQHLPFWWFKDSNLKKTNWHSDNAESTSRDEKNLLAKLKTFVLLKTTVIEVPASNSEKIARLRDIFDLGPQGSYMSTWP